MKIREQMPELSGATAWINGRTSRAQLVGKKPTLIHFWSVSCSLCKTAMPSVNALHGQYKNELNIVAVHMPLSKKDLDLDQIKETARKHNIFHPVFVDNSEVLTDAFRNQYVPAYYLFDTQGRLRYFQTGRSGMKLLHQRVKRLLGKQNR